MDINQNLEQINTFEKGMNTDTSDALLPNNQYRYAENLRFTSHDTNNTGELQPIRDLKELFSLPDPIIATSQIRNYAIFITGYETSTGFDRWKIWVKDENDLNNQDFNQQIFGECTTQLGKNISIVTRYETDKDIKIYIADGIHQLMSINLIDDNRFHSGYTIPTDIKYLTSYNELILPQLNAAISQTLGGLKPAIIQYTYVLYKNGGAVTKYAPFTQPIYLLKDDGAGYLDGENTTTAIDLSVDIDDLQGLNRIQVYRITYSQYGQDPEIGMIYDDKFSGTFVFTDVGIDIVSYSKDEFLKLETYDKIKPSVIESKGNYLFAGNIEDFQDEIDAQWKDIDFTNSRYVDIQQIYGSYCLNKDGSLYSGNYNPSLKPGETYRYGIVLYDETGRRSSVKFVKDEIVQPQELFRLGHQRYEITPIGIKVTVKNIPHCSGYEIVRCIRGANQSHTLYQGIVGCPVGVDTDLSTPAFLSLEQLHPLADKVKTNTSVAIFACPECVYLPEETKNIMQSIKTSIESVYDYYIPINNISSEVYSEYRNYGQDSIFNENETIGLNNSQTYVRAISDGFPVCYSALISVGESITDDTEKTAILKINTDRGHHIYYTKDSTDNKESDEEITTPFYVDIDLTGPVYHDGYKGKFSYVDELYGKKICMFASVIRPTDRNTNSLQYNINIKDSVIADSYKPADQIEDSQGNYNTGIYTNIIDTYTYCNLVKEVRNVDLTGNYEFGSDTWCNIYSGGKSLVLSLERNVLIRESDRFLDKIGVAALKDDFQDSVPGLLQISIANIKNKSYKGYGPINNSVFCSFGNYYRYDQNEKEIFNGDTYINVFTYNHTHAIQQSKKWQLGAAVIYQVPIQSSIDLLKTSGDILPKINSEKKYYLQDYAGNIFKLYQQRRDAYIYNAAYSQEMNLMSYTPVINTEVYSGKFDTRIKCSEEKSNGEKFDNWLNFPVVNTLDVDTRFGEITHMRLFKDALVFWQKEATGILSVNERVIVQDVNNTSILLGTGGILQRFDYISTKYGMQFGNIAETQSNTTLYWWDSYKREILSYSGGQQVQPMTELKTIKTYISKNKNAETPCFIYDSTNNEILMKVSSIPIVYNEYVQQFTSVYWYNIDHSVYFNDEIWITHNDVISKLNAGEHYKNAYLQYIVNKNSTYVKTFDNVRMGLNSQSNSYKAIDSFILPDEQSANALSFVFECPQQYSEYAVKITNREYDYRFAIPRAQMYNKNEDKYCNPFYGNRMRGKYMINKLTIPQYISQDGTSSFSLQYITTKYRISYN